MRKKIISILFLLVFCIGISNVKATKNSIDYDVIVKDLNGVILNGSYKDENGKEINKKVTIPYNEKINVLYERFENGIILGHVKYITEIEIESTLDKYQGQMNGIIKKENEDNTLNNEEKSNSTDENNIINSDTEEVAEKTIKIKKKIEVEGDIDLSKCKVINNFSLDNAIKFNKERKIMVINSNGISLYKGPAMAYGAIGKIESSSIVKYTYGAVPLENIKDDTYWIYVQDKKGWVYKDPGEKNFATYENGRILVFNNSTVYNLPVFNATIVDKLPKNIRKKYTYIYNDGKEEWYFVKFENKRGWVKDVAKGINAKITIKSEKNVKIYERPTTSSKAYDIILPKDLEIQSIYKYSKEKEAFYIEYKNKKGWIILEEENNQPNFEVVYLDDDVSDELLEKPADYKDNTDNDNFSISLIIIIIIVVIIISTSLTIYAKFKRKSANDFSVSNINNNNNNFI